jgi:hypothetical protein
MGNIAGGLAGFFEPWMTLVGHLTISDTVQLDAPDDPPDPPDMQQLANAPPEIDRINRALSTRQAYEAAELLMQQRSQTHGDPPVAAATETPSTSIDGIGRFVLTPQRLVGARRWMTQVP